MNVTSFGIIVQNKYIKKIINSARLPNNLSKKLLTTKQGSERDFFLLLSDGPSIGCSGDDDTKIRHDELKLLED